MGDAPLDPSDIDASTRFCAVYGWPVRHSASPAMQNAGIRELGLNWRYLACEVHPDDLREAISGAKVMQFIGLNLTVPHKLLAVGMMDQLNESARTWGAVNTVRFEGLNSSGEWQPLAQMAEAPRQLRSHGFNTDAEAITRSLSEDLGFKVAGKSILLLGAGGAGRTGALKLASENPKLLYLVNRTESKAQTVADQIRSRYPSVVVRVGYPPEPVDLVLNATSLGLKPDDPLPFDETRFSLTSAGSVYDMVYRPAQTPLLRAAAKAGRPCANGLGMLLYQGAAALAIWTGMTPPVEKMRRALETNVYGTPQRR